MSRVDHVVLWAGRITWLILPAGFLPAMATAQRGAAGSRTVPVALALWAAWAIGLVAQLVVSTHSLTGLRVAAPLTVVAGVASAIGSAHVSLAHAAAIGLALLTTLLVFTAEFGRIHVQASAYGDETRLPLRAPLPVQFAVVVGWLAPATVTVVAVVAFAHGLTLLAGVATIGSVALWWLLAPRFHRVSRRWLVFVPAGVVVHDQVVLAETVMFRSSGVRGVALSPVGSEAADLTGGAPGARVDIALAAMETIVFAPTAGAPKGRAIHAQLIQVAPSRPGAAVAAARRRGIGPTVQR